MSSTESEKASNPLHKTLFSALTLAILALLLFLATGTQNRPTINVSAFPTHPAYFFEFETFTDAIERVRHSDKKYPLPIIGGLVPHHLLPSFIIADFFKNLSIQKPETIILIGPNHYELGEKPILSSIAGWETPFGVVEPNDQIIEDLYDKNLIDFNEEVLVQEHSIGGIVPFIKYYIPDARIVPLVVSGTLKIDEIERLAKAIAQKINKKTVIVASVDFSHYQIQKQAEKNDKVTLGLMEARDYEKIINLSSANVDSPPSIITLLMIMDKKGKNNFNLIYHTNAGEILRDPYHEVTSYFSFVF